MKYVKALIGVFLTVVIFIVLNTGFGSIPPAGKFMSPFSGFWQNGTNLDRIPETLNIDGLIEPVTVIWDSSRVPHIFAENRHDLFMAQGYIVARDRLWQMEFQAIAAAGRLSEIVGEAALEMDRYHRRIGLSYGAGQAMKVLESNSEAMDAVNAYSKGVNAYINTLDDSSLPLEYKILDYRPEEHTPFKTALLLKYMSQTLSLGLQDKSMTAARELLSDEEMLQLFPRFAPFHDPVIPPETPWNFKPVRIPDSIGNNTAVIPGALGSHFIENESVNASNNWAVSGDRTASGYPIYCSDPHLSLTLPSIWYEMQLTCPDMNVYGVTLAGMPGITMGFNENIAWGTTNAQTDVVDFYRITFRDSDTKDYLYDGEYRKTERRFEQILIKGGRTFIDTVLYTHHGPVPYLESEEPYNRNIPQNCAMQWTAHDGSLELLTFIKLNSSKNYEDYTEALSFFDDPAQNFGFASSEGDIAIVHNGKYPVRWKDQGRYLLDGSDPAHEWSGWIPKDQIPGVKNPPRGFISSANQRPVDETYPYYLGWRYASFNRGARINEMLSGMRDITPDDMQKLQFDNLDLHAEMVLPVILSHLDTGELSDTDSKVFDILNSWDCGYSSDQTAPSVFVTMWNRIVRNIWYDDMSNEYGITRIPSKDVTADLIINDSGSRFFDNSNTPEIEDISAVIRKSFNEALTGLSEDFGGDPEGWTWGTVKKTDINHLARIPGLGRYGLTTEGNSGLVNATGRTFGPSMRLVVELGPEVTAWLIYPGGQSGNPGSAHYDDGIETWVEGRSRDVLFLKSRDEKDKRIISKTRMEVTR